MTERLEGTGRAIARSFTGNLITFSIGRDTNIHDMKTVETILDKTAEDGHRLRDILAEILKAYLRD